MKYVLVIVCFLLTAGSALAQSDEPAFSDLEHQEEGIRVELYPNPATEYLNIRLSGEIDDVKFELHNIIGNKISIDPEQIDSNHYRINVRNLSQGYYLLAVKESSGRYNKIYKFLKR